MSNIGNNCGLPKIAASTARRHILLSPKYYTQSSVNLSILTIICDMITVLTPSTVVLAVSCFIISFKISHPSSPGMAVGVLSLMLSILLKGWMASAYAQ